MDKLPQNPDELLQIMQVPLDLLERAGITIDLSTVISDFANQAPEGVSGVFPWLQELWAKAESVVSGGNVFGSIWELIKELLNVMVGLLGALVDLLRSLIGAF